MKVVVVGGGIAGTAAAWMASRGGAEVTLAHDRAGASALYSGALDVSPWTEDRRHDIDAEVLAFASALDVWDVSSTPRWLVTPAGVLRPAAGMDSALLDLGPLAGKTVGVADLPRDGWDAEDMVRALTDTEWAERTRTTFVVAKLTLADPPPPAAPDVDFARTLEDDERLTKFALAVSEARRGADAMLVGPWLGTSPETAERVRELAGFGVGETTSPPGGAAGARFEAARDRLLEALGVSVVRARVLRVETEGALRAHTSESSALPADAVVLAVGGVAAAGITMDGPGEAYRDSTAFHLSLDAPVRFSLDGEEVGAVSSLHGVELDRRGLGVLERIGVRCAGARVEGCRGLFAAGDVVAGRPRTALEAARAGIAAARAALGGTGRSSFA